MSREQDERPARNVSPRHPHAREFERAIEPGATWPAPRYEYLVIARPYTQLASQTGLTLTAQLNSLGEEGWELMAVDASAPPVYIFKRQKERGPKPA